MIRYAIESGWTYVSPNDALRLRGGEAGLVFHDVLAAQLLRLNPGVMDRSRAEDLISRLVRVRPTIEGNLAAWEYLRGLKALLVPEQGRQRYVQLVEPINAGRNIFQVTDEFAFTAGSGSTRPDVVLLVNGIPVVVVAVQAARRQGGGTPGAFDQLVRYQRDGPELLALTQLQALARPVEFLYGATWSSCPACLSSLRDGVATDHAAQVKSFLDPGFVLRLLLDGVLFTRSYGELSKIVLWPQQMRAVDRVVERAADPDYRRGLVWHTQGSGKTYSMIAAARRIVESPLLEDPTVLMLVDRTELEAQLFSNLEAIGFEQVEVARATRQIEGLLARGYRGLIISTIRRFDHMPAEMSDRENVIVLVDEANRTTRGDLGYLIGALPNATYIGFTGTPIDRSAHGQATFKTFGGGDPRGYLDTYSIRESISDGTTVPLHYALAPNELRVDREVLEREFLSLAELEGVSDVEELDRVLQRAVTLRNMLKNPDRVERVAAYVAEHFRSNVEPMGFKAFLVGVDRDACCRLKRALDRHLPAEYSRVIISARRNDPPEMAAFRLSEDAERQVRRSFRKADELPKILIVTDKLLTGFDAPILDAMYLDKPMRDHVLLQAIARVNRPYEDGEGQRKMSGFVLDFVGIFEKLERALAFDSEDVAGLVEDLDVPRR